MAVRAARHGKSFLSGTQVQIHETRGLNSLLSGLVQPRGAKNRVLPQQCRPPPQGWGRTGLLTTSLSPAFSPACPCPAAENSADYSPQHAPAPHARAASVLTEPCLPPGLGSGDPAPSQVLRHLACRSSDDFNTPANSKPELWRGPALPANSGTRCLRSGLGPKSYTDTPGWFSPSQPNLLTNCFVLLG